MVQTVEWFEWLWAVGMEMGQRAEQQVHLEVGMRFEVADGVGVAENDWMGKASLRSPPEI